MEKLNGIQPASQAEAPARVRPQARKTIDPWPPAGPGSREAGWSAVWPMESSEFVKTSSSGEGMVRRRERSSSKPRHSSLVSAPSLHALSILNRLAQHPLVDDELDAVAPLDDLDRDLVR